MDFKEVYSKKKGKTYVFCNFEELLMEAYGVGRMEEVQPYANSNGEYIIRCPLCKHEHTKHKLYIKSDLSVGHCFLCDREYINLTDTVDLSFQVPTFGGFWSRPEFKVIPLTDPTWSLDRFRYEFDDYDEGGVNYLISRHGFMRDLYKVLGIKFMDGNPVIPFKYRGEVFYYQIRFANVEHGSGGIRYFLPPIKNPIPGMGAAKPPYIIDHTVSENRIIICEGIFDAIALLIMAPDYIPCAVMGSSISDYQLGFIREYCPTQILVYLDETELSAGVANRLKTQIDYCPISIIQSNGQDPEENLKERLKYGKPLQWIKPKKFENNDVKFKLW